MAGGAEGPSNMDTGQLVGGIVILAILVFLVGGAFLGVATISAREMGIWLRLKRSGKVGEATIERLCINNRNRSREHVVVFRSPEDNDTCVAQLITGRTFRRLKERTFVTVTYLPDLPYIARLWGKDEDTWSRGFPTVLAIVFIGVAWPLIVVWLLVFAYVYLMPQVLKHPIFRRIDSWECVE